MINHDAEQYYENHFGIHHLLQMLLVIHRPNNQKRFGIKLQQEFGNLFEQDQVLKARKKEVLWD
ncbi:MAG: hypothetical protein COA79_02755 [Planctomycetota bacterium]|nr:MAG: hypothetical protein COA79_02755 [Planctomycetota bacterium]